MLSPKRPGRAGRLALVLLALVLTLHPACAARASDPDSNAGISGSDNQGKAYVNQYFFTCAMIGGGIFLLCRSSRRKREVKSERELATASKEGANV